MTPNIASDGPSTTRRIKVFGAGVALVLGVVLIAAAAGEEGAPTSATGAAETRGDAVVDDADTEAVPPGDDAEAAPDGASTDQVPPQTTAREQEPPEELGEPVDPGPTAPPAPGRYTYRTVTGDGEESVTELEVVDIPRNGDEAIRELRGTNRGHSDDVTAWTASRVETRETTYRFNGREGECRWEPAFTQAVLPLEVGSSWSNDSTCTITGLGPAPTEMRQSGSAAVIGLERRRIAGQVLDLWVIREDAKTDLSGFTISGTTTRWFSPRHGLTVRTEARGSTAAAGSRTESFISEIQDLQPTT